MNIIRRKRRKPEISYTPLIDVVLQLIIFFMLTSNFITLTAHNIDLPQSKSESPLEEKEIMVYFTKDRKIFLSQSDRFYTESQLTDELKKRLSAMKNKEVVLMSDFRVQLGDAMRVIDAIEAASPFQFTITTTPEEKRP